MPPEAEPRAATPPRVGAPSRAEWIAIAAIVAGALALRVWILRDLSLQGPFFGVGDRSQIAVDGPTGTTGLVVFLNAVVPEDGQVVLSVWRALDPTTTMTVNVPIADGVVTFVRSRVDL